MQNNNKALLALLYKPFFIKERKTNDEIMDESRAIMNIHLNLTQTDASGSDHKAYIWSRSSPVTASVYMYSKVVWECSWVYKSKNNHSFSTTSMSLKTLIHMAHPVLSFLICRLRTGILPIAIVLRYT